MNLCLQPQDVLKTPLPSILDGVGVSKAATRELQSSTRLPGARLPNGQLKRAGKKMTAEIAIMNKMSVALAADSKVTIGIEGQEKTFDTVNKLFNLSRVHPVAIMVYGNAEFMEYPWETIIKEYRKQKLAEDEDTVEAWSQDFLEYLRKHYKFTKAEWVKNVKSLATAIFGELYTRAQKKYLEEKGQKTFDEIIDDIMASSLKNANNRPEFLTEQERNEFAQKYDKAITEVVEDTPFKDARAIAFKSLLITHIARHSYSPNMSGVVFAGFGKIERFPSLRAYALDGFVDGRLKCHKISDNSVSTTNRAIIIPFAQRDMVVRFMEGIDSRYKGFLETSFSTLVVSTALSVLDKYIDPNIDADAARADVTGLAKTAFDEFRKEAVSFRTQEFSRPIIEMVSSLPREELASMAEAFVNLTSLKRRISRDRETVGGPVDVAVISKGDGFIWVKRKHYFDPKLNHHFASNYFRDLGGNNEVKPKKPRAKAP